LSGGTPAQENDIARSPLPPMLFNTGAMVEPGCNGRMYCLAQNGKPIEMKARPAHPEQE
jgi:hypothetical protein